MTWCMCLCGSVQQKKKLLALQQKMQTGMTESEQPENKHYRLLSNNTQFHNAGVSQWQNLVFNSSCFFISIAENSLKSSSKTNHENHELVQSKSSDICWSPWQRDASICSVRVSGVVKCLNKITQLHASIRGKTTYHRFE